jgi:uncharacterized protein (TIGR02145 family)
MAFSDTVFSHHYSSPFHTMRSLISTPILIALLLTVSTCKKSPTEAKIELPSVTTGAVTSITSSGATVAGNVTDSGGATVTARGVCIGTTQNSTTNCTYVSASNGAIGTFTVPLRELSAGVTYYARAFATNSGGTAYGSQTSFTTTSISLVSVTTGAVSNISSTGATVAGEVAATGGATVTARGVCYATTQNPTTSGTCAASGSGAGTFSATITGLTSGTLYYVRAYATNSAGTAYGSQASFTTTSPRPTVSTGTVSAISSSGATVAGNVTDSGGSTVTQRGVCYSTVSNATSWNTTPNSSSGCLGTSGGNGAFTISITGLSATVTYYAVAFAINSSGAAFGNQVVFTTLNPPASVTDISGNTYSTIQIGTQIWMGSNLKTNNYRNGDVIANVSGNSTWASLTSGAWAHYSNLSSNESSFGKLYNWYAVSDSRGLCPMGWRVPRDSDWDVLKSYLGANEGDKLKSTSGWNENGNGSNSSGFNARPGGYRMNTGDFRNLGYTASFWSSNQFSGEDAYSWDLWYEESKITKTLSTKNFGSSVRCILN